jgi:hypothetical protein
LTGATGFEVGLWVKIEGAGDRKRCNGREGYVHYLRSRSRALPPLVQVWLDGAKRPRYFYYREVEPE